MCAYLILEVDVSTTSEESAVVGEPTATVIAALQSRESSVGRLSKY